MVTAIKTNVVPIMGIRWAVIESQQYTDEAPYRNEWIASPIVIYTSAEMRTHYRPPIA
ncbi:hypothetical protein [Vibrio vulnificus]|uniref:hypothetical protein n=1 Tax=Vibrio vulnificus TaxID=672 RepID=UPI0040590D54